MLNFPAMVGAGVFDAKDNSAKQRSAIKNFEKAINRLKKAGITSLNATLTKEDINTIKAVTDGVDKLQIKIVLS